MRNELLALVFLAVSACCSESSECADNDDVGDGTDVPVVGSFDAEGVLSPDVSTVVFVTWTSPAVGDSWVEYGMDGFELAKKTPVHPTALGEVHEQIVLGLKTEHTYRWKAVTSTPAGRYESAEATITTGPPAAGTLEVTIGTDLREKQDPAPYILTVTSAPSAVVIYDRDGDAVWSYGVPGSDEREAVTVRPGWDGTSVLVGAYDQTQDDATGGIYRISMDGRTVVFTPTVDAHHDFVERKDGTFAYLSQDYRGALPVTGTCTPGPGLPTCSPADVVADVILETTEGSDVATSPPTQVYNHFLDSGDSPFWTCQHMEDPFPPVVPDPTFHQWTHGNSLVPDPVDPDNAYWINLRYQDALIKVSRTHELLAVIGGYGPTRTNLAEDVAFDHAHFSHIWPGGFLLFDNNTHKNDDGSDGNASRAREYSYDPDTNGSVTLVHEWSNDVKTGGMADARKASNGNVVINWGDGGDRVQERTPDDEVVWGAQFPAHSNPGRIFLINDLYDLDPPYDFWQ